MRRTLPLLLLLALPLRAEQDETIPAARTRSKAHVPLNPELAGLPDNSWVKLSTPKEHPIVRSGSPCMHYVPESGVALLWGASHSYYHNDLWAYDLARNLWRELLKTEPSAKSDPGVLKLKDGVIMTREERPLAAHQWGQMEYDPDRQALWYYPAYLWQGVYNLFVDVKLSFTQEEYKKAASGLKGPTLWKYDLKTNKWTWIHTEDPSGICATYGAASATFRYFPPLRKFVMLMGMHGEANEFRLFDPDTRRWEPLKVSGPARYHLPSLSPTLYDPKRKVFIINGACRNFGTLVLDPVNRTIAEIVPKDKTPLGNLDGNCGVHVYDSANGAFLTIFTADNFKVYDSGKDFQKKGWPNDETSVWALDYEKKTWVLQPAPSNGAKPGHASGGLDHAYYDPVQNVVLIYEGSYNGSDGQLWAYRYKRAKK